MDYPADVENPELIVALCFYCDDSKKINVKWVFIGTFIILLIAAGIISISLLIK
jgi:hypothetical protein